jgi:hypothetical protein
MTIENGRPLTPGLPADRRQASAGRVRQLASISTFILRLAATFAMAIVPVRASDFATTSAEVNARNLFRRAAVLSDAPGSIHDPRHPQPQTGADKMFAPIGLVWTNHPQPDQGTAARSDLHMGTAFLVSPCYVLAAYHVVFGYRFGLRKGAQEEAEQNVSATFSVGGKRSLQCRQSMVSSPGFLAGIGRSCGSRQMRGIGVWVRIQISAGSGWLVYRPL